MNCLHCCDDFAHCPTHVYWCSPECWDAERYGKWGLVMPEGPLPIFEQVRLGVKRVFRPRPRHKGFPAHRSDGRRYRHRVPEADRKKIIELLQQGASHHHISRVVDVARSTVSYIRLQEFDREPVRCISPVGAGEGTAGVPAC